MLFFKRKQRAKNINKNNDTLITYNDPLIPDVLDCFVSQSIIGTNILQRRFNLGITHARDILNELEKLGFIVFDQKTYGYKLLYTKDDLPNIHRKLNISPEADLQSQIDTITNKYSYDEIREFSEFKAVKNYLSEIKRIKSADFYNTQDFCEISLLILILAILKADGFIKKLDEYIVYINNEDILNYIDSLSDNGLEFENFTVQLLLKNGFTEVHATQGSGDYGIDVIAHKDGISYAIQCKCYSNSVGNKAVQEAFSGKNYYDCMVAAVFTNNYFTKAAIETAEKNKVLLWDRTKLMEFLNNAGYFSN